MTSGRVGGLKNREPHKADYKWHQLKVAIAPLPGPRARPLHAETVRRFWLHGPAGLRNCGMGIAECGLERKPPNPKSAIGNPK
jgi:hypothetical protein